MHTKVNQSTDKLWNLLDGMELPDDEYSNHTFFRPLVVHKNSPRYDYANEIIDDFVARSNTKQRGAKQLAEFKRHWQYMLMNLCSVSFQRNWLLVSLDKKAYSNDHWLQLQGLSYDLIKTIVDFLSSTGMIELKVGKRYKNNPARTRLFPTPKLANVLYSLFYFIEEDIKPPYLRINEGEGNWTNTILSLPDDHPEVIEMTTINEFLKAHHWACKAPVCLVYKNNAFNGGRLFTPFQNLSDRKVRIRINTLIDEQPICEVDFNANHLRLNLAFSAKENAGETPYEDIGEIAGVSDRKQIKRFITVAMGASNEQEGYGSLYTEGFHKDYVRRIHDATLKRYPKLELFEGWGVYAQNFEGQILKDVMLQGVKAGIVCLPVHDAVAVQQQHQEWAKGVMLETWQRHMDGVMTKVKVDMPAISQETQQNL